MVVRFGDICGVVDPQFPFHKQLHLKQSSIDQLKVCFTLFSTTFSHSLAGTMVNNVENCIFVGNWLTGFLSI